MAEPVLPPNERMGAVQVATAVLMVLPVLLPQSRIGCVHAVIAAPIGLAMPDTVAAMLPPQPLRVCWAALMAPLSPVWIFAPTCTAKPLNEDTALFANPAILEPSGFQMASTPSRLRTRLPSAPESPVKVDWPRLMLENPAENELAIVFMEPDTVLVPLASSSSAALSAFFASASRSAASLDLSRAVA